MVKSNAQREKRRKRKGNSRLEPIHVKIDWAFAGFLAIAPLFLGGTHPLTGAILAGIAIVFALLDFGVRLAAGERTRSPDLTWLILGVILLALLRNTTLFGFVSPGVVRDGFALWPEVGTRGTASPGRVALWAWKSLGFLSAFLYAANRFRRSDKVWKLALAVIGAGFLTALVGIAQDLLHAPGHLFFYTPIDWTRVVPIGGPFVNPNQAGSLAALSTVLAFGAAHQQQKIAMRVSFVTVGLFLLAYTLVTGALAALASLIFATATLLVVAWVTRNEEVSTGRRRLIVMLAAVAAAVTVVVAILAWLPAAWMPGPAKSAEKVLLWREAAAAIPHAPIFGFGAGSFADVFPYFDTVARNELPRDVESGAIQFAFEHGLVPAILVVVMLIRLLIRIARDSRYAKRYAYAPFVAVLVFVILDMSLGMPLQSAAYMLLVAALLGSIAGRPKQVGRAVRERRRAFVAVAAIVVLGLLSATHLARGVRVSLDDSRLPFASVRTVEEIPGALESAARERPLNLVVLTQAIGLRLAIDRVSEADAIVRFLTEHASERKLIWRAAFRVAARDESALESCELLEQYWNEYREVPAEIVDIVARADEATACLQALDSAERCQLLDAILPQLPSDDRFLFVHAMMERDRDECVLSAAVKLSLNSPFRPLAPAWVAELEALPSLEASSHLTVARHYHALGDYTAELRHLLAARDRMKRDRVQQGEGEVGIDILEALLGLVERGEASPDWYTRFRAYADAIVVDTFDDAQLTLRLRRLNAGAAFLAEDFETAEKEFSSLQNVGNDKQRADAHLYLARIARSEGRYRDAINNYRLALRFNPKNREAEQALEELNATMR